MYVHFCSQAFKIFFGRVTGRGSGDLIALRLVCPSGVKRQLRSAANRLLAQVWIPIPTEAT